MQKLLRGFFVLLLLLVGVSIAVAEEPEHSDFSSRDGFFQEQEQSDNADLRVIPDDGVVGETFTILISDLNANEEVTIRIIFVETDTEVYTTSRTADSRGRVELEIFTESSDSAGTYRVEVLNEDDEVIGETELTLESMAGREGLLTVSPSEAEVGTSFTIDISEVAPFADLLIVVTNEAGDEVFRTGIRATVDGTASVSFTSSETSIGNLNVQVLQNETIPVASGSFVVQEQQFPATVNLDPASAMPGDEVFVTVSGLEADAAVTVVISNEGGVLLSQDATANLNGLVIFSFVATSEMALGDYTVEVLQADTVVARTTWTLDVPAPTVTITPTVAVPSSYFLVEVTGLVPAEQVVIELAQGETILQSFTVTGDADGYARAVLGQRLRLTEGDYEVRLTRSGHLVFTQTVSIVAERDLPETTAINPDDVTVSVSPESGVVPTEYVVTITGLPADTDLSLTLLFDGRSVLTFQGTADSDGVYTTTLTSETSDPIGTYTLEVRAAGELIGTAEFAITDEEAGVEPTEEPEVQETPVATGELTVRVSPETVRQGERFEIFVTNLEAGETVTVELRFDGETVYSSEQTANAEGALALALTSESSDEVGQYEVVVLRDGEEIASSSVELVASDAAVNTAELSISPESAPQGSSHTLTVSGLEAGETVTISVTFEGEEVFSGEREADSQGVVTFVLTTDSDDAVGDYNVSVTHANGGLIGSFSVTEGDSSTPPSGEVAMTIEPSSGEIGTVHEISVTGLDANEDVSVRVEFGGETIYETTGTANEDGVYTLALATEEGDAAGSYTVIVERENGDEVSSSFITEGENIETTGDFALIVSPEEVTADEPFDLTVTGLEPGETVVIVIFFDGEIVYQSSRDADENGELVISLALEEDDPSGTYTAEVQRNNGEVASVEFEVLSESAQPGGDEVTISVEPESGEIGTRHDFTIIGLEAGETVTIVVELDGEEVYTTEATANPNGVAEISLTSEEGDEIGNYDFIVQRENGDEFSASFSIEGEGEEGGDEEGGGAGQESSGGEIVLGDETYTGVLTDDEPEAEFTFEGEEGQGVQIAVTSEQFDTYLMLLDANGDELANNDDSNGSLNSTITTTLPYSGEYTIVVTSFSAVIGADPETGRFSLTAQEVEIEEAIVELGEGNQFITENLSSSRPELRFVFEGEEGEMLLMSADSAEFDTYMVLYDEDGDEIARNDDSNGTLNSQIGPFELPEDGEYTVLLTSYYYFNYGEAIGGEFNFRLETVSITETAYGEALELEISAESASQFIEFEGSAGDVISVSVNSNGSIDTTLSLLDPTGYALEVDDDGGLGYDPEIERYVLPSDGTYMLMLRAFTVGDTGEVEVLVNLVDEQSLDDGTSTVRLNSKQSYDILVFEGTAGESVDVVITIEGGSVGSFAVYAEQGEYTLLNYQSYGIRESITLSFRVPADGMVRVIIQDNSGSNVVLNVQLVRDE